LPFPRWTLLENLSLWRFQRLTVDAEFTTASRHSPDAVPVLHTICRNQMGHQGVPLPLTSAVFLKFGKTALLHQSQKIIECRMLRRPQPLKRHHLGRHQLGAIARQPVKGGVTVALAA